MNKTTRPKAGEKIADNPRQLDGTPLSWHLNPRSNAMPFDLPPPAIVTTISEPAPEMSADELYGPIDTEQSEERDRRGSMQMTPECPQSSENVIVVCAPTDPAQHRLGDVPPPRETSWDALDAATTIKLGPVEIQPQLLDQDVGSPVPAKGVGVGMRVRF